MERLVLVGNGMAGVRTLEELIELAPDRYEITVFGDEPHGNYNRIGLSGLLAGESTFDDIVLNGLDWYRSCGIDLRAGNRIIGIDRARRHVVDAGGQRTPYDKLILATGSTAIRLPLPGGDLPGVVTFRDVADVDLMIHTAKARGRAVVIGGGLLGLEAAHGLMQRGMEVCVVHLLDSLMEKQLDRPSARMLARSLERRGVQLLLERSTTEIVGRDRVQGVRFDDGNEVAADLVVMAVGIRPNMTLAKDAGIHCGRGVVVSDTMQTFDPRIYAVGECVEHRGMTYGLVAPLFEQARVCANQLARDGYFAYRGSVSATKLKVTGVEVFSAGLLAAGPEHDELVLQDAGTGLYKKLVVRGDRLEGVVLYGDTSDATWYLDLIRSEANVSEFRSTLLHGRTAVGGVTSDAAALPDSAQICDCNGVCKSTIVDAIRSAGLTTLSQVKAHTKAAASCGSCSGAVQQILAATLGDDYPAAGPEPMCSCTALTHDDVRAAIAEQGLRTMSELMAALQWQAEDGCARCRPALNYYLLCTWPGEYTDDAQSRLVNERVHANIQKDGTYSVVPRIFGGVTTPAQLRAIAAAAERYKVPTVKITGGQRIDLLGVHKSDLPDIWRDLGAAGFVSGHAYGKALRTVKTCVGEQWCRFGVQDSTRMGIRLEETTWGSWSPHKFKMAVSGCPRNCAEATIKDFGAVAVDAGWELHVGGNGGMKVRAADVLCRVETQDEVEQYATAFFQLYREDARYLERTAPWVERVGIEHVRARIVADEQGRRDLSARFATSQQYAQHDPWAQPSTKLDARDFVPLRRLTTH